MITAEKIAKLSTLDANGLDNALINSGYSMFERPKTAKFLGITTGGNFCYQFTYKDNDSGLLSIGKLFVDIDETGKIVADY